MSARDGHWCTQTFAETPQWVTLCSHLHNATASAGSGCFESTYTLEVLLPPEHLLWNKLRWREIMLVQLKCSSILWLSGMNQGRDKAKERWCCYSKCREMLNKIHNIVIEKRNSNILSIIDNHWLSRSIAAVLLPFCLSWHSKGNRYLLAIWTAWS